MDVKFHITGVSIVIDKKSIVSCEDWSHYIFLLSLLTLYLKYKKLETNYIKNIIISKKRRTLTVFVCGQYCVLTKKQFVDLQTCYVG